MLSTPRPAVPSLTSSDLLSHSSPPNIHPNTFIPSHKPRAVMGLNVHSTYPVDGLMYKFSTLFWGAGSAIFLTTQHTFFLHRTAGDVCCSLSQVHTCSKHVCIAGFKIFFNLFLSEKPELGREFSTCSLLMAGFKNHFNFSCLSCSSCSGQPFPVNAFLPHFYMRSYGPSFISGLHYLLCGP